MPSNCWRQPSVHLVVDDGGEAIALAVASPIGAADGTFVDVAEDQAVLDVPASGSGASSGRSRRPSPCDRRYGRSTCVTIMPTFCEAKSCARRSARERAADRDRLPRRASTPYLVEPKLPLALTAAVMSPAPAAVVGRARRRGGCRRSWLKSDGVVNSNGPWFSVKNGRLSLKKVSLALKLTTMSSLSTWPKSGLMRGGQLELAVRLPEDVGAGVEVLALAAPCRTAPTRTGVIAISDWL